MSAVASEANLQVLIFSCPDRMEFTSGHLSNVIQARNLQWLHEHNEIQHIKQPPPSAGTNAPKSAQCYQIRPVSGRGIGMFACKKIERGQRIIAEPVLLPLDNLGGEYNNRILEHSYCNDVFKSLSAEDQVRFMNLTNCFEGDPTRSHYGENPILGRIQTNSFGAGDTHDMVSYNRREVSIDACRDLLPELPSDAFLDRV